MKYGDINWCVHRVEQVHAFIWGQRWQSCLLQILISLRVQRIHKLPTTNNQALPTSLAPLTVDTIAAIFVKDECKYLCKISFFPFIFELDERGRAHICWRILIYSSFKLALPFPALSTCAVLPFFALSTDAEQRQWGRSPLSVAGCGIPQLASPPIIISHPLILLLLGSIHSFYQRQLQQTDIIGFTWRSLVNKCTIQNSSHLDII